MKKKLKRSACPIGMTLDIVGDRWSLLIVRSLMFAKRKTFKDLATISENIATNILSDRLESLERTGIIMKLPDSADGRRSIYVLTEKGLDLMPVLLSMIAWGTKYNPDASYPVKMVKETVRNKTKLIKEARKLQKTYN
jgi:DNA-binding HxlR family transcriptional regulator